VEHPVVRRSVVDDVIVVEYGQFQLQDSAGFHQAGALEVDHSVHWRMVAGLGGARFHSDSNDRRIPVRLEVWENEPPPGPWPVVAESVLRPESAEVRLRSVTGGMTDHSVTLAKAEPVHIRASVRSAIDETDHDYETDIQEEWLVQLWPVDRTSSSWATASPPGD
jgi:hypothetical protein